MIVLMSFLGSFEVVARTAFGEPTVWSLPISQYLLLCATFLGASYCLQADGHISIELFIERLGKRARMGLRVVSCLLSIVYVAVLLFYTWRLALLAGQYRWNAMTDFPIPSVILYAIMVFGWAMLLVTLFHRLLAPLASYLPLFKSVSGGERN